MAVVAADLVQCKGQGAYPKVPAPVLELPPLDVKHITAEGLSSAFHASARSFEFSNRGDPIWFRVNKSPDTTIAAPADSQSIYLATGDAFGFMLPDDGVASDYAIDVRLAP